MNCILELSFKARYVYGHWRSVPLLWRKYLLLLSRTFFSRRIKCSETGKKKRWSTSNINRVRNTSGFMLSDTTVRKQDAHLEVSIKKQTSRNALPQQLVVTMTVAKVLIWARAQMFLTWTVKIEKKSKTIQKFLIFLLANNKNFFQVLKFSHHGNTFVEVMAKR